MPDQINNEINIIAEKMEKSAAVDQVRNTISEIGIDGIKKALPNLSPEQKILLKSILDKYIADPEDSTVNGDYHKNLIRPFYLEADEELVVEDKKNHRNQGGNPIDGWEGQIIKSEKVDSEDKKEDKKEDEKEDAAGKKLADAVDDVAEGEAEEAVKEHEDEMHSKEKMKNKFKKSLAKMVASGFPKDDMLKAYGKRIDATEAEMTTMSKIWDIMEKAQSYKYDDSTTGKDLEEADQSKPVEDVKAEKPGDGPDTSVQPYQDKAAEDQDDDSEDEKHSSKTTADAGVAGAEKEIKKSEKLDFRLTKSEDPFSVRKIGQNAHYNVDEYLAHDYLTQLQKSDTFLGDWEPEMLGGGNLKKGGEGSKGGKVIGHTKSGKPIYDKHDHPEHASYTKQDHRDAARLHTKLSDEADAKAGILGSPKGDIHFLQAEGHKEASRAQDKKPSMSHFSDWGSRLHTEEAAKHPADSHIAKFHLAMHNAKSREEQINGPYGKVYSQEARKNKREQIKALKEDAKQHLKNHNASTMKKSIRDIIADGEDVTNCEYLQKVSDQLVKPSGAFLVKSFNDSDLDDMFKEQDYMKAGK